MNVHEFAELSAGHALGALSAEDERAYADALAAHPEWEAIARPDEEAAAALADGFGPVAPPLELRSKLLAAIRASVDGPVNAEAPAAAGVDETDVPKAEDPPHPPVEPLAPASVAAPPTTTPTAATAAPPTEIVQAIQRRTWTRGVFALVASMALLVGVGWGAGAIANLWQTPATVTALEQIEAAPDSASARTEFEGGVATAYWSQSVGKVVLVAEGLPRLAADRTFELWFVRGQTPIAAGTFDTAGATVTAELVGQMQPGDTIAVTVEPAGGSPDGTPSTAPLFAIPTA